MLYPRRHYGLRSATQFGILSLPIKLLVPVHSARGLTLPFDRHTQGWLLKTHFNYLRRIRDRETDESYPVDDA